MPGDYEMLARSAMVERRPLEPQDAGSSPAAPASGDRQGDTMTREEIEAISRRKLDGLLYAHGVAGVVLSSAEQDALCALALDALRADPSVSAEMVALQNRAFAEGQASIYAEIRKLPSPWKHQLSELESDGVVWTYCHCDWCGATSRVEHGVVEARIEWHPANDCLWFKAHAERR